MPRNVGTKPWHKFASPFHILVIWFFGPGNMTFAYLECINNILKNQNMWKPTAPKSGDFISSLTSNPAGIASGPVCKSTPWTSISLFSPLKIHLNWQLGLSENEVQKCSLKWQSFRQHDDEPSVFRWTLGYSTRFSDPKPSRWGGIRWQ